MSEIRLPAGGLVTTEKSAMRSRLSRLFVAVAVIAAAAVVTVGLRTGVEAYQNYQQQKAVASAPRTVPTSPQIEQQWGIRVTLVQLMADNGLVELRYLVVDSTKAAKLHADTASLTNIPWLKIDGTDLSIKSRSVMYHFQHGVGQGLDGRTYSIIYGNAGNAIHSHATVTVVMPDGLELQRIPVQN
jgi:hypothetical protein